MKLTKQSVDKVIKNEVKSEPGEGLKVEVKGSTVLCSEKKVLNDKLKKGKVKSEVNVVEKLTITVPQSPTPSALVSLLEKEPPVLVVDEEYEKQKTQFLSGFQLISKKVLLATPKKQPMPSTSKLPSPKIRTSPKKSPKLPDLKFNNPKKIPKIPQIPILPKKIVHPHLTPKFLTHPVKEVAQVSSTSSLLGNPLIRKKRKYTFKTRPLGKKAKLELEQLQNLDRKKPKLCCVEIAPNHPSLMSDKVAEKRKHVELKPIKPAPSPHSSSPLAIPHPTSPPPPKKANSLQTLFDNCKLNIPSSLSITLTENQDKDNPPTVEALKNQGNIQSPPMFIEIFKLPEKEPPKIPPLSSPVTTLSNGNFLVTTTGIQSLGRDLPATKLTKVAKQNFIPKLAESPKSTTGFQKMFEEAIKKKERSKSATPPPLKLNVTKKPKTEDATSSLSPPPPPATTTVLDLSSPVLPVLPALPALPVLPVLPAPSSSIIPIIKKKVIKKPPQSNLISSTESLKRATTSLPALPALSVSVVSNNSQASNKSSPNSISSSSGSRASALSPTEIQNQYNLTNLAQLQHVMMLRQQLEFRNSLSQLLSQQQQSPQPAPLAALKPAVSRSASPRHSGSSPRTDNNAATLLHFEKYMKSIQHQVTAAAASAAAQSSLISKK